MKELDAIELDEKTYAIIAELEINGTKYLHLANPDNVEDFFIRKIEKENGKEVLTGLDSKEELDNVLAEFSKKHREDLEI